MVFKLGDIVTWNKNGKNCIWPSGYQRTGAIVEVVAPKHIPTLYGKDGMDGTYPLGSRDHESYVVRVGRTKTYWPRVASLSLAS